MKRGKKGIKRKQIEV